MEFLIDNCFEIFGENIPTHSSTCVASDDSLEHTDSSDMSTLQNDSAYDSNDPELEPTRVHDPPGEPQVPTAMAAGLDNKGPQDTCGSSLEPIVSTVARLKSSLRQQADRRLSEPSRPPSQECLEGRMMNQKLTKSEDNFTMAQADSCSEREEAEDPFPEEVFSAAEGKTKRPADLRIKHASRGLAVPHGVVPKALSSGSLDGSSDCSPVDSPSCPKRNFFTRHQSFTTKTDKSKPNREIKKHSMSFSFASHKKVLPKAPSFGSGKSKDLTRDQIKKSLRKESQLAGRIVQENGSDFHSQTVLGFGLPSGALSGDDVFQHVDGLSPGRPPSYEEAIQYEALGLGAYGGQTVGSMRARMLNQDSTLPSLLPSYHGGDSRSSCSVETLSGHGLSAMTEYWRQSRTVNASVETRGHVTAPGRPELRLRTMSES